MGTKKKFLAFSGSLLSGCRKFAGNGLDQKGSQRCFGLALGGGVGWRATLTIILKKQNTGSFPASLQFHVPVLQDFREKNMDYMRPDIVALLRSSDSAFVRELIGMDPVAVFRWAVLRAAIRAMAVFAQAGRDRAQKTAGGDGERAGMGLGKGMLGLEMARMGQGMTGM